MQVGIPQLTFTRFLAAISVVIFHFGQDAAPFDKGFLNSLFKEGGITVSYFFFLSGFLLYYVYGKQSVSLKQFYVSRAARIVPLYALGFVLALVIVLFVYHQKPYGGAVILQGLFLHAWFPGYVLSINYPSWSVSVELVFYLLFPALLFIARRIGETRFIVLAIILWLAGIGQNILVQHFFYDPTSRAAGDFIMYFPVWHINTFVSGIAAGMIFCTMNSKKNAPRFRSLLLLVVGVVPLIWILTVENSLRPFMHNGLLAPLYAVIVIGLATDQTFISKFLSRPELIFLGEISFGIYMLQAPVWLILERFSEANHINLHGAPMFYSGLFILVLLSATVYIYFEKPIRYKIRERFNSGKGEKM